MRLIDLDRIKPIDFPSTDMDGLDVVQYLNTLPTIEAEPVKHGRWEETVVSYHDTHTDEYWDEFYYEHRACGYQGDFMFNYCPNCGAKMDLEG